MSPRISSNPEHGYLATPHGQVGRRHLTRPWGLDNQVFTNKYDNGRFFAWLRGSLAYRATCKFVVVPDVVGDAAATLRQWPHFSQAIRALGYPAAYAIQDGQEYLEMPTDYDALFVGGSTAWKLSLPAVALIREAQAKGKWVHVGRVNRLNRFGHCQSLGVDSVDGTSVCFAPDINFKKIDAYLGQGVLL